MSKQKVSQPGTQQSEPHQVSGPLNIATPEPPLYVCGTRAVIRRGQTLPAYRVVCATCGAGGTVPHLTMQAAMHSATMLSNRPCLTCGAR